MTLEEKKLLGCEKIFCFQICKNLELKRSSKEDWLKVNSIISLAFIT